ncbi:hypothetical protein BVX97_00475 [bacterium E08(2017)]|nr:hypothetical protein BVX97_00475 [bacterium E08(2017)]
MYKLLIWAEKKGETQNSSFSNRTSKEEQYVPLVDNPEEMSIQSNISKNKADVLVIPEETITDPRGQEEIAADDQFWEDYGKEYAEPRFDDYESDWGDSLDDLESDDWERHHDPGARFTDPDY